MANPLSQLASGIYSGRLMHARWAPKAHQFQYKVFMAYLDLDELDALCARSPFWSCTRAALFWIRRQDYFGDPAISLKQAVHNKVHAALGFRPMGPVRMLTNPRCFGVRMNPITVFYVFDKKGEQLEAVLAEVTNTPWDKRHVYVLDYRAAAVNQWVTFGKELHVSPFMPLSQYYRWKTHLPGDDVRILLQNFAVGEAQPEEVARTRKVFEAQLALVREPATSRVLNSLVLRFPWMTLKVAAAIYWQALKLWLKGAKFYSYQEPDAPAQKASTPPTVPVTTNNTNNLPNN
ncbi:DUF1365 domain-containing protein [Simiduia sp. 21SJ11W-1]|uniref:DUF1365 domain-containing protein n=1 Tax=Simiduia sp. 21SJ11W-1 TaxID=2909669 RepID=UPI0020A11503|nr:DUF1365 domain-containing protein [Simiduia sp. 21SJ11W-1]UTA48637.1 DUF1365 domain-containing protein [Simiduia sp. 21SJ11W-1]